MRALKGLFIFFAVVIGGAIVAGFLLPDEVHVERSIVTSARPGTVYAAINGFRQFNKWSPWVDLDPDAAYSIDGPPAGVGARSSWASEDPNVGSGSQEIVEVRRDEFVRMRLVFSGFDSENYASFTLVPEGEGTRIVWSYDTRFRGNLMGRYFGLMLDQMVGADYEKGLARLKVLVEALPVVTGAVPMEVVAVQARPILYVSGETGADQAGEALAAAYGRIGAYMAEAGLKAADAPLAITRSFDQETRLWTYDAAIVPDRVEPEPPADSGIQVGETPAGYAIRAEHLGAHDTMEASYEQVIAYKLAAGLEDAGLSWEQYMNDPVTTPPAELRTHLYWAVK